MHTRFTYNDRSVFNVGLLRQKLKKTIPTTSTLTEREVIDDFVFLSLMMGNDYLPKIRSYDFITSWQIYKMSVENQQLCDSKTKLINWPLMKKIFDSQQHKLHTKNAIQEVVTRYLTSYTFEFVIRPVEKKAILVLTHRTTKKQTQISESQSTSTSRASLLAAHAALRSEFFFIFFTFSKFH